MCRGWGETEDQIQEGVSKGKLLSGSTGEVTGVRGDLLALPVPFVSFVVTASFCPQLECTHDFVHVKTSGKCLVDPCLGIVIRQLLLFPYVKGLDLGMSLQAHQQLPSSSPVQSPCPTKRP